jgi:hypothetical protein
LGRLPLRQEQQDNTRAIQEARKRCPKWKTQTATALHRLGIPLGEKPWTGLGVKRLGLPACPRVIALVNVAFADRLQETGLSPEEAAKGFYADICQSVTMYAWGNSGTTLYIFCALCILLISYYEYLFDCIFLHYVICPLPPYARQCALYVCTHAHSLLQSAALCN